MQRPLSPHLGIYKPQLTSVLSILHRITGVAMMGLIIFLALWILGIALGSALLERIIHWLQHALMGRCFFAAGIWVFFYHMLNGVRHLMWDWGYGFELKNVYRTGLMVLMMATLASLYTCMVVWL